MEKALEQLGAVTDWLSSLLDKPISQFTLLDIGGIGLIILAIFIILGVLAIAID